MTAQGAFSHPDKALSPDANYAEAYYYRGMVYYEQKDLKKAYDDLLLR